MKDFLRENNLVEGTRVLGPFVSRSRVELTGDDGHVQGGH